MASARRYYRFALALGIVAVAIVGWTAVSLLRVVQLATPSVGELLAACREAVFGGPRPALFVVAFVALGLVSAAMGLRSALGQVRSQRRVLTGLPLIDQLVVGRVRASVFIDEQPHAFCGGLVRPRIFVSTGAVRAITDRELEAVLAHEAHHALRRDPLRVLVANVLRDALFFLPVMRHVAQRYLALAELAADEAAVHKSGGRAPLASAMLSFEQSAPNGMVGIAAERVDHLMGKAPQWQLSLPLLAGGALTLAAVGAVGVLAATAAPSAAVTPAVLVMQACAVVIAALPVLGAACLVVVVRRARGGGWR